VARIGPRRYTCPGNLFSRLEDSMPESPAVAESPQIVSNRRTALVAVAILGLAIPTLFQLILDVPEETRDATAIWFAASGAVGAILPFLYWSPYRALGLVPLAALAWLAAVGHGVYWHEWPAWAHGAFLFLVVGALRRGHRGRRSLGIVAEIPVVLGLVLAGMGIAAGTREFGRPSHAAEWFVLGASVALVGWTWARLFRPLFELCIEPPLWLSYRIYGRGPGLADFPRTGPCLVIANHACWLDPIFLAKLLPRPTTPMMTARFYDLPIIRRLMVAFGVIRVPEKALKKDAPEIQEAIAALDRGECVVIFPEGYLRRTEDRPLRRFGQGVWQILKARPNTPVFAAWIEGGWGSYTSYFNGKPTKNKKKDFRRPLGVGMSAAAAVPAEHLEGHLDTRIYLMNLVSAARKHLGLEPLPPFDLPARADEADDDGE
jgi:1-acyl-sn-glycerol-3-phosphate acyltransferase